MTLREVIMAALDDACAENELDLHQVSRFTFVKLVDDVHGAVEDFLIDQQFEEVSVSDLDDVLDLEDDGFVTFADASQYEVDPEVLLANAEEFVNGCERADFLTEQYGEHFLRGVRDRLNNILGDNG